MGGAQKLIEGVIIRCRVGEIDLVIVSRSMSLVFFAQEGVFTDFESGGHSIFHIWRGMERYKSYDTDFDMKEWEKIEKKKNN